MYVLCVYDKLNRKIICTTKISEFILVVHKINVNFAIMCSKQIDTNSSSGIALLKNL